MTTERPTLRPRQVEAHSAICLAFREHKRVLAVMATGAGKTIVAGHGIDRAVGKGSEVLVLAHAKFLVEQFAGSLRKHYGLDVGVQMGGEAVRGHQVVCSTSQTERKLVEDGRSYPRGLLVYDEAHRVLSPTNQAIADYHHGANGSYVLGLTATPCRGDQRDLMQFFDVLACDIKLEDEIRDGNLSPLQVVQFPVEIDLRGAASASGDYEDEALGNALAPYLDECARELAKFRGRRMLVFLPLVKISKAFQEAAQAHGLDLRHVDGTMKSGDVKGAVKAMEAGSCDGICNPYLMSEGVDIPSCDLILNLRPTKSWTLFAQILGRGTRLFPGKSGCLILDPLFMCDEHSLVRRPAALLAHDEEEEAAIEKAIRRGGGAVDLLDAAEQGRQDRAASLVSRLKAQRGKGRRTIDPLVFACEAGYPEMAGYQPVSPWEFEAVTQGQADVLRRHGIDVDAVTCKGVASKMISVIFDHINCGRATPRECAFAEELGMAGSLKKKRYEVKAYLDAHAPKTSKRWKGKSSYAGR